MKHYKAWYRSKTFWFNVLALICIIASRFGYTGELREDWQLWASLIVAIINLILRFVTKQPITIKRRKYGTNVRTNL